MAPEIHPNEVCDYHFGSQALLTSINTKLTGLIWVIGVGVTVFALPTIVYVTSLEKRLACVENQMVRLVAQRNADHPAKDTFQ